MMHTTLTAPWISENIIFIHGPTRNLPIPFFAFEIPCKNILTGRKEIVKLSDTWSMVQKRIKLLQTLVSFI